MLRSLHARILAGGLVGIAAGLTCYFSLHGAEGLKGFIDNVSRPIGQVFLRLLFMLVVPLVFSALALGVAGLGDLKSLGRVGLKTLLYTVAVSTIAVVIGLAAVRILRPGEGMSEEARQRVLAGAAERAAQIASAPTAKSRMDFFVQIVPDNPIKAAANGDMLAIMFFALLFGVGILLARSEATQRLVGTLEGLYEVLMRLIHVVIGFAPIGVAALLFTLTAEIGWEILVQLGRYVGVVLLALAIHQFVIYPLSVRLLGGLGPIAFFRGIQAAMLTAFSTSSSSATLPTALQVAEDNLKLPKRISRFVLTIGATANQNGTALYEGVTVLFLAQFYGISLSLEQQLVVLVLAVLGGIGTAGVPGGSLPMVAAILGTVGVPVEGIGLILGVDRLLDMCRTVLNVSGDLAAAVVVSRGEGRDPP